MLQARVLGRFVLGYPLHLSSTILKQAESDYEARNPKIHGPSLLVDLPALPVSLPHKHPVRRKRLLPLSHHLLAFLLPPRKRKTSKQQPPTTFA